MFLSYIHKEESVTIRRKLFCPYVIFLTIFLTSSELDTLEDNITRHALLALTEGVGFKTDEIFTKWIYAKSGNCDR